MEKGLYYFDMRKHTPLITKIRSIRVPRGARHLAFGAMCAVAAFAIGLETAGDVRPFEATQAALQEGPDGQGHAPLKGDMDLDGELEVEDAMMLLAYVDGLETPSADDIRLGDADGDFRLSTKDVMRVLHALSLR